MDQRTGFSIFLTMRYLRKRIRRSRSSSDLKVEPRQLMLRSAAPATKLDQRILHNFPTS